MDRSVVGERYRVEARIGSGGMAEVYRGFDTVLNRTVAIKVLLQQFARDAGFVARFRREAQAAARLNHPNIVGVYDTGSDGDTQFIVMEFVEGRTLHDFLRSGKHMGVMQAVELTEKLTDAVSAAHAQGVIHRDIKPANVMVTREGAVKVMDFGIARIETAETAPQTSAVLGTAAYLSPEQAQGMPVDARTDIYSLGTVLYELLCGRPPFTGDSPVAIAYKQVNETPEPPSALNPDVSPHLDAVVMKALSKNPANRYQTARAFRDDLERVRRGQQVDATPLLAASNGAEATQVIARPQSTQVLPPQSEDPRSGRKVWLGVLIGVLVVALLAGGGWLLAQALGDEADSFELANYRGDEWVNVEADLRLLGLVPQRRDSERDPEEFAPETVIRTSPTAGTNVQEGDTIAVFVAVEPEAVVVPGLVGLTPEEAADSLSEVGLVLGDQIEVTSDEVEPGQIASQSPAEGDEIEPGAEVDVEVSTGPSTVEVPSVTCQKRDGAITELEDAGLVAEVVGSAQPLPQCANDPENIAMQDPAAGTSVEPGTVVQLWTSDVSTPDSPSPSATP